MEFQTLVRGVFEMCGKEHERVRRDDCRERNDRRLRDAATTKATMAGAEPAVPTPAQAE